MNPPPAQPCPEENPICGRPGGRLQAVSCASQSLCVLASSEGFFYASSDPTGPASGWSPTNINEPGGRGATHLAGVSCPSNSLCVAFSGGSNRTNSTGTLLTSTNPIAGNWQTAQLPGSPDLRGVSCGTPSLCVAVARGGRLFVSTNPTGGASAWQAVGTPAGQGDLEGVSCASSLLCVAGTMTGNVLTSTNPAGGGAWSEANAGGSVQITGLSCPNASHCVAVDNNGDVSVSSDPTGGPAAWRFENLIPFQPSSPEEEPPPPGNAFFGVSCGSTALCALVGVDGRIFTSAEPFAAPGGAKGPSQERRVRRRPRTVLLYAERFWRRAATDDRHVRARFRFYSPTQVKGFECKHDQGPYRRCRSPLRYWVGHGRHALRVRAIGPTGLRGPAAIRRFRVDWPPGHVAHASGL